MPGFDGTGPRGQGPMTGGARGYCAMPVGGYYRRGIGRGMGRGGGRGWRNWYYATGLTGWQRAMAPADEAEMLKNEAEALRGQLEDIQNRISALEKAEHEKEEK